jgi:hypothetical protein
MLVVETEEKVLVDFETAFCQVQYKGQGNELEHIDFIPLTVVIEVLEEVLLVGQFVMIFEMVERLFEDAIVDTVLVFVVFVALLPPQIYEHLLGGFDGDPARAGRQDSVHEILVIPISYVILERLFWLVEGRAFGCG